MLEFVANRSSPAKWGALGSFTIVLLSASGEGAWKPVVLLEICSKVQGWHLSRDNDENVGRNAFDGRLIKDFIKTLLKLG